MRALPVLIAVTLLAPAACTGPQAARVRRPAELAIGGSLLGVLATSIVIAAAPSTKPESIGVSIGFGGLAVLSTVVYAVAYSNVPAPAPPPPPAAAPDHRPEAWGLTQQAQSAARGNDCATVQRLSTEVAALDGDFHAVVFARDAAIARCLAAPR